MTNALIKTVRKDYTPGSPGVPSSPGSPARAAYTSIDSVYSCGFDQGGMTQVQLESGAWVWVPKGTSEGDTGGWESTPRYLCGTRLVNTFHPAQAATPAIPGVAPTPGITRTDYSLGWSGGARSVGFFTGDGFAQFKVRALVGGVIGLNDVYLDPGYTNIESAFYFSSGVVRVYENGVQMAALGTYAYGDVFRLERRSGTVRYYRNGTLVYTGLTKRLGAQFLQASLYSGGDEVYDPSIGDIATISATMLGLRANGGDGTHGGYTGDTSAFMPMTTSLSVASRSAASFAPMVSFAGSGAGHSASRTAIQPMVCTAESGAPAPSYALGSPSMSMLSCAAHGLTGEIGGTTTPPEFPKLVCFGGSGTGHALGRAVMQPMASRASAFEGNMFASMLGFSRATADFIPTLLVHVTLSENGSFTTTAAVSRTVPVTVQSSAVMTVTQAAQAVLAVLMQNVMTVEAGVPVLHDPGESWVVNWDTGASSSYEDFPVNSFGQIGHRYYGAKADGIYLLEGDDDEGVPVRASANFGMHDFGTQQQKRVPNVYLGVASTGAMLLKVTAAGAEYIYEARSSGGDMATQRVDTGMGLKANYFTFEMFNNNGCDFNLDSVEFKSVTLKRRI